MNSQNVYCLHSEIYVDNRDQLCRQSIVYIVKKTEAVARGVPEEKMFLEISQGSLENTRARVSFLIKLQACNIIKKETLAQVLSCEFCEISKNTFFYRTHPVAAFE